MSYPISILLIFISRANKFLQGLILSKATTGAGQQGQLADDCHDHSFCDFSVYLHAFWVKKIQQLTDQIFADLNFVFVYLDNILNSSGTA